MRTTTLTTSDDRAVWTLATPNTGAGAIALVQLTGDIDHALELCGIRPVAVGAVVVRDLLGVDTGVVARWTPRSCQLMPHGGMAVVRQLAAALAACGLHEAARASAVDLFPEARSRVEALALEAVSRAASPLAIDLLLDQHRRWLLPGAASDPALDKVRNRLIDPPLVVALGPPNIGKSTLVNALAGRTVSIVADVPGTTRDHVGVVLDLGGLVVRYVDTPGIRPEAGPMEAEVFSAALRVARSADLLLLCGDVTSHLPDTHVVFGGNTPAPILRLALRTDLGTPAFEVDCQTSALLGDGLPSLVALLREALVPAAALANPAPWRFWTGP